MKRLIIKIGVFVCLLLTFALCTSGTAPKTRVHASRDGVVTEIVEYADQPSMNYEQTKFHIRKFKYEGHTYLYFKEEGYSIAYAGLTHDENCECRKQEKD